MIEREWDYPLAVKTMYGLGDTVYQRPLLRALGQRFPGAFVRNPWPELLEDLDGLKLCRPTDSQWLHAQHENVRRHADRAWEQWPAQYQRVLIRYRMLGPDVRMSIIEEMETILPLCGSEFVFDLPSLDALPVRTSKPIAVVRPNTVRKEWMNKARNCRPEYIREASKMLRKAGFHVVAVAMTQKGTPGAIAVKEWLEDGLAPEADSYFLHGELDTRKLMSLIEHATICVGSVGFIVPTAMAYGTPVIAICGGQGHFNHHARVVDKRIADRPHRFLVPEPYCRCEERLHKCKKDIPDFAAKFEAALEELCSPAISS